MLLIVMHNNSDYLRHIECLARQEGVKDMVVINRSNLGAELIGSEISVVFLKGQLNAIYHKAFVAKFENEDKARNFLDILEKDEYLEIINLNAKGFICTLPFNSIQEAYHLSKVGVY